MKRIVTAIVGALLIAAPAGAADLKRIYQAPDYGVEQPVQTGVNWTGFYVGGRLGYGNANHELSAHDYFKSYCGDDDEQDEYGFLKDFEEGEVNERIGFLDANGILVCKEDGHDSVEVPGDSRQIANLDGLSSTGVVGGFQVGADQRIGDWVVGAFGSYDFSNMRSSGELQDVGSFDVEKGDEWSAGVRAGRLLSETTLLYGLVAYAQTDYNFSVNAEELDRDTDVTFDGVAFGGGLEHAITESVFLGIEGTHTVYGDDTVYDHYDADSNRGVRVKDELGETKVMGTLKVKFN